MSARDYLEVCSELLEARKDKERLDAQLAESARLAERLTQECTRERELRKQAELTEDNIQRVASELEAMLRDHWECPDRGAATLYCAAIVCGFSRAWKEDAPANGIAASFDFPEIGRLEIQIRRVEGKTASESIGELRQQLSDCQQQIAKLEEDLVIAQQVIAKQTSLLERIDAALNGETPAEKVRALLNGEPA